MGLIVTVCRTLNEERNITRFCWNYQQISDVILICDGGSDDRTVQLASKFSKVVVEPFQEQVRRGNVWRNPHGRHLNFMFDWAIQNGAEWIIYDDCDSIPNATLKRLLPGFMELQAEVLKVKRLYTYKNDGYFPQMSDAGYAKWAWRAELSVRASEDDPWAHEMIFPPTGRELTLFEPCCLLHYSYPSDEEIARKAEFYKVAKSMPDDLDWEPLEFGGEIEPLPEWAVI